MIPDPTIAAIATPLGEGGLGVIRISGPAALSVADRVFRSHSSLSSVPSHTIHHGYVQDFAGPVDEAVAAVFRSPRSYTGEDVVELSCHGGTLLLRRVLDLCLAAGARLAEPGEFTKRAFLNGKMDLAQAEAVADLIAARSDALRRLALDQLQGRLSTHLQGLRRRLLDLLAHLEANLDFAEEEVPDLSRGQLKNDIRTLLNDVWALLGTSSQGRVFREGLRAVFLGKPNVGKSSLFNALLGADRAIVTEIPGTTRDTLEEQILVKDVPVTLTDTAGFRPGADRLESEGMSRARRALDQADVAVFVVDVSDRPSPEDRDVASLLQGKRAVLALNKCDKISDAEREDQENRFFQQLPSSVIARPFSVFTSARTGQGLEPLCQAVLERAEAGGLATEAGPVPTLIHHRHVALLKEAAAALENAEGAALSAGAEECVALDLRQALDRVNEITGQRVTDEVLHTIFSRFCIGK